MRFADIAKGTRAVKPVVFRLANAPLPPPLTAEQAAAGVSALPDHGEVTVGVRVLTGAEQLQIFADAQADAAAKGVKEWKADHPICRLAQMARTLLAACVDSDNHGQPFFASVEEVLSSPELGTDNIALLFEAQDRWQDECSFGAADKSMTIERVIGLLAAEAERPENAESPLLRMRPSSLGSYLRTSARLFALSVRARSDSGSFGGSNTNGSSSGSEKPPDGLPS